MKKVISKIIKTILWILISVIVLFNVYNIVNLKILKNKLTTVNGYTYLEVVSGSMEPTIKIGDLVLIDTKDKAICKNDIITFYDEYDNLVTHRVIALYDDYVITKGDANNTDDGKVMRDKIVGRYISKLNAFGYIIQTLKNPLTLVIILAIGVVVCFLISTDKDGKALDVDKDYIEFINYKKSLKENKKSNNDKVNKKNTKKKTSSKK